MRLRNLLFLLLLWIAAGISITAQEIFQRTIDVKKTSIDTSWATIQGIGHDRFILASSTENSPNQEANTGLRLTTFDRDGRVIWSYRYDNSRTQKANAFAKGDGQYFIAGAITMANVVSGYGSVVATDTIGNVLWSRALGYAFHWQSIRAIAATTDGGAIAVGEYGDFAPDSLLMLVARFDSSGSVRWIRLLNGGQKNSIAYAVAAVPDGFLISGSTGNETSHDGIVTKLDDDGNLLWMRDYDTKQEETLTTIVPLAGGDIIVAGDAIPVGLGASGYIMRLDSTGLVRWSRITGPQPAETICGVVPDQSGRLALLTGMRSFHSRLMMLDADGSLLSSSEYGRPGGTDISLTIAPDEHGFVITSHGEPGQLLMMHTDADLNAGCDRLERTYGINSVDTKVTSLIVPSFAMPGDFVHTISETRDSLPTMIRTLCNGIEEPATARDFERIITLNTSGQFNILKIHPVKDGYYVSGTYGLDQTIVRPAIVRLTADGEPIWGEMFGRDIPIAPIDAVSTSDGGVVIVGYSHSYPGAFAIRIDDSGNILWSKVISVLKEYPSFNVCETADHGFALTVGYGNLLTGAGGNKGFILTRLDSAGNLVDSKVFRADSFRTATGITATRDGGLVVGGFEQDGDSSVIFMTRLDRNDNLLWRHTYATTATPGLISVAATDTDDGFTIGDGLILLHIDGDGVPQWARNYDWWDFDNIIAVHPTKDGGTLINVGGYDTETAYLIKADPRGAMQWSAVYDRRSPATNLRSVGFVDALELPDGHIAAISPFGSSTIGLTEFHLAIVNADGQSPCDPFPVPIDNAPIQFTMFSPGPLEMLAATTTVSEGEALVQDLAFTSSSLCAPKPGRVDEDPEHAPALELRPQPAKRGDRVTIRLPFFIPGTAELAITDMRGIPVSHVAADLLHDAAGDRISIETGNLPPGVYLVAVSHAGTIARGKLIVR